MAGANVIASGFISHLLRDTGRVYCVPIEEAPASCMYLRVKRTLNGQKHRVRWASNYDLPA
jgi:hypothetical protein